MDDRGSCAPSLLPEIPQTRGLLICTASHWQNKDYETLRLTVIFSDCLPKHTALPLSCISAELNAQWATSLPTAYG